MSWKDRAPKGSGPPKKTLSYISGMLFVVDGYDIPGKEFVKVHEMLQRGEPLPNTKVVHHALLFLRENGHVVLENRVWRAI
jgi:hypothetical protein